MPWKGVTEMSLKREFVQLAGEGAIPFNELCKRFTICRTTGYKWLTRYKEAGEGGLKEYSRRPHRSPKQTPQEIEQKIVEIRKQKPGWGARKIRAYLLNGHHKDIPATSTVNDILKREGYVSEAASQTSQAFIRFERPSPNDLWQIDFKGHFRMAQGRCHPLTILDDHSRYNIGLRACDNERKETVERHIREIFQEYGLPAGINVDNGPPWGGRGTTRFTALSIWWMRLGIRVSYSRPFHPQTNGKDERFHRTLKRELLTYQTFRDLVEAQEKFDEWRDEYNFERPHEALNDRPPVTRYQVSRRPYPDSLKTIEYADGDEIRKVTQAGNISFKSIKYFVGEGFRGLPLGIRKLMDDRYDVYFCSQKLFSIDLRGK